MATLLPSLMHVTAISSTLDQGSSLFLSEVFYILLFLHSFLNAVSIKGDINAVPSLDASKEGIVTSP